MLFSNTNQIFCIILGDTKTLPDNWRGDLPSTAPSSSVSVGSSDSSNTSPSGTTAPGTSSATSQTTSKKTDLDSWAFRYRHSKSSMTFVVKALRLGSRLSVHAFVVEQDDIIVSLELQTTQYIDSSCDAFKLLTSTGEYSDTNPWTAFLKNLEELHTKYKKEVMIKLMPEVEDLANQLRLNSRPNVPQNQNHDPLRVDNGNRMPLRGGPPRPSFDYDEDLDPGFLPAAPPGFAYSGDDDLFGALPSYGQVPGGFNPRNPLGGPLFGRGGGSQIGPHHPGFGPQVNDPFAMPGGGRGGGGGYYVPPPQGARFDPFGPPINPAAGPRRNPNPPDAPPDFENWYS